MELFLRLGLMLSACLLIADKGFSKTVEIQPDEDPIVFKAEALEDPYKETETYIYTKSPSFTRWVYNPWLPPKLLDGKLEITSGAEASNQSVLITDLRISTKHLPADKSFQLLLKSGLGCSKLGDAKEGCLIKYLVRCYDMLEGQWQKTVEFQQQVENPGETAVFELAEGKFPATKCPKYMSVSLHATVFPKSGSYRFSEMSIGFKTL